MAECIWNILGTREVCSRNPKEVWDDGMQGHDTPMTSNLKLLSVASSEIVDSTMYHQMIGSLMYLMNMRPDIFFDVITLCRFLIDPCSLDGCKSCSEVPEGYS